ncbi:MAG TPA: hypothetical protein VFC19_01685 [Candidatus Limnocylindrales bacterium]|nr:hypothetical protein [Candidatus Limnocylindrales bacterium]
MRRVRLGAAVLAPMYLAPMYMVSGALRAQGTPSPQPSIDGFPVLWLAIGGGLAVAALILYFLHIRRL